jgi:photosystem II stability/assembly factor-like uncharacterized protein
MYTRLPLLLCVLLLLVGIFTHPPCRFYASVLDQKSQPYEQFAFQRSYPDPVFDWKGWQKTLRQLKEKEQAEWSDVTKKGTLLLNKGPLDDACAGNITPWALKGPGNVAGRCNTLAVQPGNDDVVLAGFAAGGVFKSTDGAVSWHPVFDDYMELAIGDLVFSPIDPNIVYAGTGDPNIPSIVFNGDGLYKSTDAGETWQYVGLREVGIISKVVLHPVNPQIIWVAAMGNPYSRTPQRGIYKSVDGGATWQQTLFVSTQAGASDLVMSAPNPDILYAAFWERLRNNREAVLYGPDAGVWKSTDGGATWSKLGGGLPTGKMGRVGLAVSQQNPNKVFAVFVDTLSNLGGVFRTSDGGQQWSPVTKAGIAAAYSGFGWYFGKLSLNPANDEDLYLHAVLLWQKASNNSAWEPPAGGHADSHDLVFTPSGRRYWANDGGVARNDPGQLGWRKSQNLPTTQIYHTNFNPLMPDQYFIGAQDNGIKRGNAAGFNNWISLFPADGFRSLFHPSNPNTYWLETQDGAINKTTDGGQTWHFTPPCLGTGDRCNWDMPLLQSVFNPLKFYAATDKVYANVEEGGWSTLSGDLTNGNVLGPQFHNVSALNESPLQEGQLYAGTSDGRLWRNAPGTAAWTNITTGLPNRYVTSVQGSPTYLQRIFVTHSGYRDNENSPHIHRSDNNGQTWTNISGNLPPIPVNDLWVMPGRADTVLFAATDGGVYFTTNGGGHWARLGSDMPYIPVFDLEHNPVQKVLLAATFARGLYAFPLDSVFVQRDPSTIDLAGAVNTSKTGIRVRTDDGTVVASVPADTSGIFFIPGLQGCRNYTVIPFRNDDPLNGVTTLDLSLISRHILNIEPFDDPYKMIAADVNQSGTITTLDIVALRRVILGIDSVFLNNTSWRFVPKSYLFSDPFNPFTGPFPESVRLEAPQMTVNGLQFVPVKVGDVNQSAQK